MCAQIDTRVPDRHSLYHAVFRDRAAPAQKPGEDASMAFCAYIQIICSVNGRALSGIQVRNCNGNALRFSLQIVAPKQDEFHLREIRVAAANRSF